jgi:fructokinase
MNAASYHIGIDLGGTKIESVLLSPQGAIEKRKRLPTPQGGSPQDAYTTICKAVLNLIHETQSWAPPGCEATVGIGIPGTINAQTGLVQNANTTCLIGRPFQKDLEEGLGRNIGMENDANCFVLAEVRQGAARGHHLVFGVIMGTGCGGGLCIDGRLHRGRHLIAGEWGHFAVDPQGARCYCGNPGCVETKISGGGVEKSFLHKYGTALDMRRITEGYRQGDARCRSVFEQFLEDFGRCLGGLISILDPDAVVLGGGLSNIDELYTLGWERVRRYAFHQRIETPLLRHQLGDSAGVIGAAWIGV